MELRRTYPNVGNDNVEYVHCPHCSRMHLAVNEDGEEEELPSKCRRCGCPLKSGKAARDFMNAQAEAEHVPALAELGRKSRGEAVAAGVEE